MTDIHRIQGTDRLLMQTIQDQAADLEHGWREAIQNGIDSPDAGRVELEWDTDMTIVRDNGAGVDLSTERGLELLKNLGETSKADDPNTIGQFGVGKGQVVAKGHTVWMSGDTALHFDVERWGLTVKTVPLARPVDGLEVRVSHYEDEVPRDGSYRWDQYERRLRRRFRYAQQAADVEVYVNGDLISDDDPADDVSGEYAVVVEGDIGVDFVAALEPTSGDIDVYSRGVYVKSVDGHGASGTVVTRENLDLNFARNDIKSGCEKWGAISEWLDDRVAMMLEEVPENHLNDDARGFLAERAMNGEGDVDPEAPMFKTVSGESMCLNDIVSKGQIGFDKSTNSRARKLAEGWHMTILDEDDDATGQLKEMFDAMRESDERTRAPDEFNVDEKADEVSLPDSHETMQAEDVNTVQARKLAVARELAERMGCARGVNWGESEVDDAWTDGSSIVLTDSAAPSRARSAWIPEVYHALVHQWSHRGSTEGGCDDQSASFRRRFTENTLSTSDTLSEFINEVNSDGLEAAIGRDHLALVA